MYMANTSPNAKVPSANYIPLARVGARMGSVGVHVGSVGVPGCASTCKFANICEFVSEICEFYFEKLIHLHIPNVLS